ncbi:hypothetical protein TSUD_299920 [Trifolium subterraneum]|uniref:ABC transmembrane type-1 domain-containing protein n=1 Tax=Trifolium subterraneum TaxID=3900 RepID=A0A2Z6PBI2_TRISU|nr:hypothetical protein TSUD_299920 [Trifolium subterraneum]
MLVLRSVSRSFAVMALFSVFQDMKVSGAVWVWFMSDWIVSLPIFICSLLTESIYDGPLEERPEHFGDCMVLMQRMVQMKFLKGFSADAKVMYEEASQVANDVVSSIRTVASFCAESKVMDMYMYRKKCLGPEKQGTRLGLVSGIGLPKGLVKLLNFSSYSFMGNHKSSPMS